MEPHRFPQSDLDAAVNCSWRLMSGPSQLIWSDTNSCKPTINGLTFGDYEFALEVTDRTGQQSYSTTHIGAVAMDDDGVVIQSDPKVTEIFGPMIAFGKNPWGYADERALTATRLRYAAYAAQNLLTPSWETPQAGTVSYLYNGRSSSGATPTTLCAAVADAATTSIVVCDAARLDLSELPARIFIGNIGSWEEVRICDATGSSGEQTLSVCYDGRGQAGGYRLASQGME